MRFATSVTSVAPATDFRRPMDVVVGDTELRAGIEPI